MTVPSTTSSVSYIGTGSSGPFPFTWQVNAAADLVVYTQVVATGVITLLVNNLSITSYVVTGIGVQTGGTITLTANGGVLPIGTNLFIASDPAEIQPLLLQQGANFNASDLMNQLDYMTREIQATRRVANNALQFPVTESLAGLNAALPAAAQRASKSLSFDSLGNVTVVAPLTGSVVSAPLIPVVTAASLGAARIAFGDILGEVNTVAALKALATTDLTGGQFVRGYYAAGDGGGGLYFWNASDSTTDNGGTIIQPNSGGTGRWNLLNQTGVYSVKVFGAKVDGATDDTSFAQACINYVQSINGGTVYIPNGTMRVSTTLLVTKSNVQIRGGGGDTYHDGGSGVSPATKIQWVGGATPVIQIKTASGVGNAVITGSGVQMLAIDGNATATYGIDIFTIRSGVFENLYVANVTTASYHTNCGVSGTYAGEPCDVQFCRFIRCTWRNIDFVAVQGACGFYLDGSSNANTSINYFELCLGETYCNSAGSVGFLLACADNNVFMRCSVLRINTVGGAVQVNGTISDGNHFFNCTFAGNNGILIKGTASGFVGNSTRCSFWGMDGSNGTTTPVYDAGCVASFHLDTGVNYKLRTIQACFADSTNFAAALANLGTASAIIDNVAQNHLLFSSGGTTPTWGINVDGSGNIRFLRQSGTGIINLGNGTDMMFGGMRITYGTAPPSTGSWNRGDKCWQSAPAVGSPKAWQCTVTGTPGTWQSEGNL